MAIGGGNLCFTGYTYVLLTFSDVKLIDGTLPRLRMKWEVIPIPVIDSSRNI
jgi:hypothetical protein